MTPEQFVVWLRGYLKDHEDQGVFPLGFSPAAEAISYHLSTVVIKTQPPQPGIPGVLGQGLVRMERPETHKSMREWATGLVSLQGIVRPMEVGDVDKLHEALEPDRQVQLDTSEIPVFRGGGCQ